MVNRNVVYEYNKNASPSYIGCRFYTSWTKPVVLEPNSNLDIIAEDVSNAVAQRLVREKSKTNTETYLNNLPKELRSARTDDYIKNLLNPNILVERHKKINKIKKR